MSTVDIILSILTIIHFSFVPDFLFLIFRYTVIVYLLLKYLAKVLKSKILVILLLLYTVILGFSTWANTVSFTWTISAVMMGLNYLVIFLTLISFCQARQNNKLILILIRTLTVFLFFNDMLMLIIPYDFFNPDELYFIGNKFQVSFLHCFLGALLYAIDQNKIKSLIFMLYSSLITLVIHCTTGTIVCGVFILIILTPDLLQKILEKPYTFIAVLSVENILIWGSAAIFSNPIFINIITEVFHKSANMTGRTKLYAVTLNLVLKKPLWGYGYNTDIYRDLFGYGNAQNGLFHIIIQTGIIGAIIYFLIIYIAITNKSNSHYTYGFYIYLYAMLVGSAVEINLSSIFMFSVASIYACNLNIPCSKKFIRKKKILKVKLIDGEI